MAPKKSWIPLQARALVCALALLAGGCATNGDPRDPFEPMNRAIYHFNDGVDHLLIKPAAELYTGRMIPEFVRTGLRNFFSNINDVIVAVNDLLQGKFEDGVLDWARFGFNTSIGLFGIHDVATDMGLEKHNEDFGQTFGRWGVAPGAYLVLPFLGSSSVRDGVGTALDLYTDPMGEVSPNRARNSLIVLRVTSLRADLLEASRILEEAALDKYVFQRDAYLQRRRSLVYDGRPPRRREEE